ncbi:hypothetical protein EV424DRAFT_1397834 [Suillus variegatus]|nr:hypothetical protein EV424DRAFT_1397834 [Suillus variegatus]
MISYEYILQLEKEVKFVWERQWSVMTYLYLAVRYFGILVAMYVAVLYPSDGYWGGLFYMPEAVSDGIFLFMQWGNSVYSCLTKGKSRSYAYILTSLRVPISHLQSSSSGVCTPCTTNPSPYFMFYWGCLYLSSRSI